MKDLGWINGYKVKPQEWLECNHKVEKEKIARSAESCTCKICNITYKIDSGD